MPSKKSLVVMLSLAGGILSAYAHQALTKDGPKKLAVLSTTDIIGYTTPCG